MHSLRKTPLTGRRAPRLNNIGRLQESTNPLQEHSGTFNRVLCGSTSSGGQFANMVEEDGALELVELRGVSGNLGEERVGGEDGGLVAVARGGVTEQRGDVHLERLGETVERGQRRHGLAVLDLGDVGAGDAHAGGELALGEIADVAKIAHGSGDLESTVFFRLCGDEGKRRWSWLRELYLERLVAAPAESAGCAELHQGAVVATEYLPLFDGRHHCCHSCSCGRIPEQGPQHTRPITEICDVPRVTLGIE